MSHCSFQTQFASVMELLAEAALAEIHRRVDDRCARVTVELRRNRKDIDALKRKCVMMESELRRVKGRGRRRVWISGTSEPIKRRCVTSSQHLHNTTQTTQHNHNKHQVVQVVNDEIRSSEVREQRSGDERENVLFEQNVEQNVQENTESQECFSEEPEFLHAQIYTEHSEQMKLDEERTRPHVKVEKEIKEEENFGDDVNCVQLWSSVIPENTALLSQNTEHLDELEPSGQINAEEQNPSFMFAGRGGDGTLCDAHRGSADEVKMFSCSFCSKSFRSLNQFKEHLCSHTGEKPFTCDQCGRSFTKHCNLTRHAVVHSGEKPFRCAQCGKCFTQRCSLKSHQRVHSKQYDNITGPVNHLHFS